VTQIHHFAHHCKLISYLESQFSSGGQNQGKNSIGVFTQFLNYGQSESESFTAARFGSADAVFPFEDLRNTVGLDGGWGLDA
jgi:hypothetical protein